MIPEILQNLGLTPEETDFYLSLLNNGQQSASQLAKSTKIKRTYIYSVSVGLIKKGLVSQNKKGRATVFAPQSPDKLLSLVQTKKQAIESAESSLEGILPSLKTKFQVTDSKPIVTYFEGVEGVKKVYLDTLKETKDIYAFMQNADVGEFRDWLKDVYLKQRVKKGIGAKVILASGPLAQKYKAEDKQHLRQTKIVSAKDYPFRVEVNIYGDKLAIMNYQKEGSPVGIIIENGAIAKTMLAFFELTWAKLSKN